MTFQDYLIECSNFDKYLSSLDTNYYSESINHFNDLSDYINEHYYILPFDNVLYLNEAKINFMKIISDAINKILEFISRIGNMFKRIFSNFIGFFKKNRVKITNTEIESYLKFINNLNAQELTSFATPEQLNSLHKKSKFLYPSKNMNNDSDLIGIDYEDKEIVALKTKEYPESLPHPINQKKEFGKWWDLVKTKLVQYLNEIKTIDVGSINTFRTRSLNFVQLMTDFYASWAYLVSLLTKFLNFTSNGILLGIDYSELEKFNSMFIKAFGEYNKKTSDVSSDIKNRTSYQNYLIGQKYSKDFNGICKKFIMHNKDIGLSHIDDEFVKNISKIEFDPKIKSYINSLKMKSDFSDNVTENLKKTEGPNPQLRPDKITKTDKYFEEMVNKYKKFINEILETNSMDNWLRTFQDQRDTYFRRITQFRKDLYSDSFNKSASKFTNADKNLYETVLYTSKEYNKCIKLSKIDLVFNVTLHKYGQDIIENNIPELMDRAEKDKIFVPSFQTQNNRK